MVDIAVPPDTEQLYGSKNGDRSTLVRAEPFVSGRIEWSLKDFLSCRSEFYAEKPQRRRSWSSAMHLGDTTPFTKRC